jgi:hypothetical protein
MYIDANNLNYFWQKAKSYIDSNVEGNKNIIFGLQQEIVELKNKVDELNNVVNRYHSISSQSDIMEAIKLGKPFKLTDDVKLDSCITLNEGEVCNIDLNGHTIKGGLFTESNGSFSEGDSDSFVFWNRGGVLNIYGDGVVEAQNAKYSMAVWAQGGTTIINGGTYTNAGEGADLIYASANGTVEVYNGYFEACIKQPGVDGTNNVRSALNVKDADYRNGTAKIVVYGGEFVEFDPSNNVSEGPNTNFVAEGYKSVLDGDVYKVIK